MAGRDEIEARLRELYSTVDTTAQHSIDHCAAMIQYWGQCMLAAENTRERLAIASQIEAWEKRKAVALGDLKTDILQRIAKRLEAEDAAASGLRDMDDSDG